VAKKLKQGKSKRDPTPRWAQRYLDVMNAQARLARTPNQDPDGLNPNIQGECTLLPGQIEPAPGLAEEVARMERQRRPRGRRSPPS
jgi:hypothetical protein